MMKIDCTYAEMNEQISFVNPYNFVDIDFSKKATGDINKIKGQERLTGVVHCIMTTKTPIAVPDTEKKQPDNAHKEYNFMAYPDGKHFIPASSIRGTIRSVFETATDSCFSTTRYNTKLDERLSAKRGGEVCAGVLVKENGTWRLYKAERYMLRAAAKSSRNNNNPQAWDDNICPAYVPQIGNKTRYISLGGRRLYDGDKVRFTRLTDRRGNGISYKSRRNRNCAPIATHIYAADSKDGSDVGYLVIGEPIRNKHHSSVFKVDIEKSRPENYDADVIDRALEGLRRTVNLYNDKAVNNNLKPNKDTPQHFGYPAFERMEENGCIPIWYLEEDNKKTKGIRLYFMMANIGRRAFYKTLNEHLREKVRCTDRKHLCPACRLFGVANGTGSSIGSRVRFTDAVCMTEYKIEKEKTMLTELGKPRTSYMPFYSSGSKSYYDRREVPSYDNDDVTIRGRKYYWHSENFVKINNNVDKTERNSSMQLAQAGAEFKFDIYFDGILKDELRQLVWAVNFFENDKNGVMCHKIGHGKPIGLGSVKIYVDSIYRRLFDDEGYHLEPYNIDYEKEPIQSGDSYVKQLKTIINFENCPEVQYPSVKPENEDLERAVEIIGDKNALASHNWFTENKSGGLAEHEHDVQFLPKIPESGDVKLQQQLFVYTAKAKDPSLVTKLLTNRSDVVWIASYKLDSNQKKNVVGDKWVDVISEWATEDNIRNNAGRYRTILLPSRTREDLIKLAKQLYEHVHVATKSKNSKKDDGWKKVK